MLFEPGLVCKLVCFFFCFHVESDRLHSSDSASECAEWIQCMWSKVLVVFFVSSFNYRAETLEEDGRWMSVTNFSPFKKYPWKSRREICVIVGFMYARVFGIFQSCFEI